MWFSKIWEMDKFNDEKIFSEAYWQIPNRILLNGWLKTKTKHPKKGKYETKGTKVIFKQ